MQLKFGKKKKSNKFNVIFLIPMFNYPKQRMILILILIILVQHETRYGFNNLKNKDFCSTGSKFKENNEILLRRKDPSLFQSIFFFFLLTRIEN